MSGREPKAPSSLSGLRNPHRGEGTALTATGGGVGLGFEPAAPPSATLVLFERHASAWTF